MNVGCVQAEIVGGGNTLKDMARICRVVAMDGGHSKHGNRLAIVQRSGS